MRVSKWKGVWVRIPEEDYSQALALFKPASQEPAKKIFCKACGVKHNIDFPSCLAKCKPASQSPASESEFASKPSMEISNLRLYYKDDSQCLALVDRLAAETERADDEHEQAVLLTEGVMDLDDKIQSLQAKLKAAEDLVEYQAKIGAQQFEAQRVEIERLEKALDLCGRLRQDDDKKAVDELLTVRKYLGLEIETLQAKIKSLEKVIDMKGTES